MAKKLNSDIISCHDEAIMGCSRYILAQQHKNPHGHIRDARTNSIQNTYTEKDLTLIKSSQGESHIF